MKRYLNLNGISWVLDGDTDRAMSVRPLAQKMMHVMKMQNVNNLDHIWYTHRMEDGTVIRVESRFGRDSAYVYCEPYGGRKKIVEKIVVERFPVLGIWTYKFNTASPYYTEPITFYQGQTPPVEGGFYFRSEGKDGTAVRYQPNYDRYEYYGKDRHYSLRYHEKASDDTQDYSTTTTQLYTNVDDVYDGPYHGVIFQHEVAFRKLTGPEGTFYNVDPLLVTCGDYVQETPYDFELYTDTDRAIEWNTKRDSNITVLKGTENEQVIVSCSSMQYRDYEYEMSAYPEWTGSNPTYVPWEELHPGDFWTEERINNLCYDGYEQYEIWDRGRINLNGMSGCDCYWEDGYDIPEQNFSTVIYNRYDYYGKGSYEYDYKLIFYANGKSWDLVHLSTMEVAGTENPMPDDLSVSSFYVYDFYGSPVVCFSYVHYLGEDFEEGSYSRHGIWYAGELYLTEKFPWVRYINSGEHDIDGVWENEGRLGVTESCAFGIDKEKVIEKEVTE